MAKLIASVLKKVPVPGVEFSNQQFSGGLEVEIPDDADTEAVRLRLRELYALLSETVEAEIAAASEAAREAGFKARFPDPDANPGNGGVEHQPDDRRRGYGPEGRDQSFGREHSGGNRDRGYRRDYGDGRGYRAPDCRDDRRDGNQRPGGWQGRHGSGGGNGGNRGSVATQAQVKAVFGIAKGQGLERRDILERIEEQFGVRRVEDLNVRQASQLIESLKAA